MSSLRQQSLEGETWRSVVGSPRYLVSNLGRVFSTIRSGRILRQTISNVGYPYVSIMGDDGRATKRLVHRLVADAFLDGSGETVNHKNGIKTDAREDNLEWCTYGQNNDHARATGLNLALGENHYRSRLTAADVVEIRAMAEAGSMHKDIASRFGVGRKAITKIVNGQRWRSVQC